MINYIFYIKRVRYQFLQTFEDENLDRIFIVPRVGLIVTTGNSTDHRGRRNRFLLKDYKHNRLSFFRSSDSLVLFRTLPETP